MGYWGLGIFENDDAMDLLNEFEEQNSFSVLVSAIELVITDDLVEVEVVNQAVAAIDIIAAINESKSDSFPELDSMTYDELVSSFKLKGKQNQITSADISYIFRSPIVKAKLTGFYTKIEDANEISFYYADGVGGDNTAFVQEILQGIDKKQIGAEFGIEAQVTPTISLKGAAAVGQYTYDNNPNLYSDDKEVSYKKNNFYNQDYSIFSVYTCTCMYASATCI